METRKLRLGTANERGEEAGGEGGDAEQKATIGVFLLIENRFMGDALARVLRRREDLTVVGRGCPGEVTTEMVAASGCDVVLLDFAERAWLRAIVEKGEERQRPIRPVALGMDVAADLFLEAVRGGIRGYLLKDASAADVVSAVRSVVRGDVICPPQLCAALFQETMRMERWSPEKKARRRAGLTIRQQNLMALVAQGLTNKEISKELNLSEFTVRNHISRILKQLDAESRSEAVEVVREYGYEMRA